MNVRRLIGTGGILAILASGTVVASAQTTSRVFPVQVTLTGVGGVVGGSGSIKLSLKNVDLINFALGTNSKTAPVNVVLGLATTGTGNGTTRLIVFNKATSQNLATIGTFTDGDSIDLSSTKTQFASLLTINQVGSNSIGLTGGTLMFIGGTTMTSGGVLVKATGTVSGWAEAVSPGNNGGVEAERGVFTKGTFSTLPQAGTLVEP